MSGACTYMRIYLVRLFQKEGIANFVKKRTFPLLNFWLRNPTQSRDLYNILLEILGGLYNNQGTENLQHSRDGANGLFIILFGQK